MLDTVRLSVGMPEMSCGDLVGRGWTRTIQENMHGKYDVWATCELDGVRFHFGDGFRWLTAETSLPGLVLGDNAQLLTWDACERGLSQVQEVACDASGFSLPSVDDWNVTRLDALWAWPVEPGPYIAALRFSKLPRTQARAYGSSVDWVTRGHRIRARFYDKTVEVGAAVDLPSRLERQVRPRKEVVRLDGGERLSCRAGDLEAVSVKGLLCDCMASLGLDKPIPSVLGLRGPLVETHGRRRGTNLFRVLLEARAYGGWPGDVSKQTQARYKRLLSQAGIHSFSLDGELPALSPPVAG
jgi:hypothetical protein